MYSTPATSRRCWHGCMRADESERFLPQIHSRTEENACRTGFLIFNKTTQPMRVYAVLRNGAPVSAKNRFINAQQLRHIATESPCEYLKT